MKNKWFLEQRSSSDWHLYGLIKMIIEKQTPYQYVQIFESSDYGLCLAIDGKPQAFASDEYIYHEALIHPTLLSCTSVQSVLIMGDGDGGAIRELAKYPSLKRIVWVDIDREIVDIAKNHLRDWHDSALNDTRLERVHIDARSYLKNSTEVFDCIISALTEPLRDGPSVMLYTKEFYDLVASHLALEGCFCTQAGGTISSMVENFASIAKTLACCFAVVAPYQVLIPSFGLTWGFIISSQRADPRLLTPSDIDKRLCLNKCNNLLYYDGITHNSIFSLPKDLRQIINQCGRISTDNSPIYVY